MSKERSFTGKCTSPVIWILAWFVATCCFPRPAHAQSRFFEAVVAYPISRSAVTFSRSYDGRMHLGIAYSGALGKNYRLGASTEYARFRNEDFNVNMHVLIPSAMAAYRTRISGRYALEGTLHGGFAWIFYRVQNVPEASELDESGLYIGSGIGLVYQAKPGFGVKLGFSYRAVFEHFGLETVEEASTIRWIAFGIGITWNR